MAITLIENQAINFRLESEPSLCKCEGKCYCQKINQNDVSKFQILSNSIIENGDFSDGGEGWEEVETLTVSLSVTNASFDEDCNGAITVTATGGDASYEYSIDGINFQVSNLFENLCEGCFNIVVKDSDGLLGFASDCVGKNVDCSDYSTPDLFDLIPTKINSLKNCFLFDLK